MEIPTPMPALAPLPRPELLGIGDAMVRDGSVVALVVDELDVCVAVEDDVVDGVGI